jgi:hypothetical protein
MNDEELLRFGKAARFMCQDKSPRQVFVIQLEEAKTCARVYTTLRKKNSRVSIRPHRK